MKQLVCEMCGGHDLVKQDGVFVCQNCGTKYSVEEAKKMMVEGTVAVKGIVEVEGKVAVDKTKDIDKLFVLARREKESGDKWKARRYYSQIEELDPSNWEAYFYTLYYDALGSSDWKDHKKFLTALPNVFKMLLETVTEDNEIKTSVQMMAKDIQATQKGEMSHAYYNAMEVFGDNVLNNVPKLSNIAVKLWKKAVKDYLNEHEESVERNEYLGFSPETLEEQIEFDAEYGDFNVRMLIEKIQKRDNTYINPLHEYAQKDKKLKQQRQEAEEAEELAQAQAQSQLRSQTQTIVIWVIVLIISIGCVFGSIFLASGKMFWIGFAGIICSVIALGILFMAS